MTDKNFQEPAEFPKDRPGSPLGNWDELGEDAPAANDKVVAVLGAENAHHVVAHGILRMAEAWNADQWNSAELWRDISGINADALRQGGYEGEIPDLVKPEKRPQAQRDADPLT